MGERFGVLVGVAAAAKAPVILNLSPLTPEFIQARVEVDTLILNAYETATLVAKTLDEINAEPQRARAAAHCRQMIITRGGDPTNVVTASGIPNIAPPQVTPVDTVGTGDAFADAFTVASASGMPLEGAIRFANASEAVAMHGWGAQLSISKHDEIVALMGGELMLGMWSEMGGDAEKIIALHHVYHCFKTVTFHFQ